MKTFTIKINKHLNLPKFFGILNKNVYFSENKLREAEVKLFKGYTTGQICRKLGITEQTYYRWSEQYIEVKVEQTRRFKELKADLYLD